MRGISEGNEKAHGGEHRGLLTSLSGLVDYPPFFPLPPTRISVMVLLSALVMIMPRRPFSASILVNTSFFRPPSSGSPASSFLVSGLNTPLTTLTFSATGRVFSGPFSPFLASAKVTLLPSTLRMTALISSARVMPTQITRMTAVQRTFLSMLSSPCKRARPQPGLMLGPFPRVDAHKRRLLNQPDCPPAPRHLHPRARGPGPS